jgi:hypothetical protein
VDTEGWGEVVGSVVASAWRGGIAWRGWSVKAVRIGRE